MPVLWSDTVCVENLVWLQDNQDSFFNYFLKYQLKLMLQLPLTLFSISTSWRYSESVYSPWVNLLLPSSQEITLKYFFKNPYH